MHIIVTLYSNKGHPNLHLWLVEVNLIDCLVMKICVLIALFARSEWESVKSILCDGNLGEVVLHQEV